MSRVLTLGLLVLLAGCNKGTAPVPSPSDSSAGSGSTSAFPVTITDSLQRKVTLRRKPERIISLAPSVTETLFAVGAGPRVVAVTTTDSYPPEVKNLPTVGGFSPKTISTETVLSHRPDLIFSTGRLQKRVVDALARLGLTVIAMEPTTFAEVAHSIEQVGQVTGCKTRAKQVASAFRRRLARVRKKTAKVPKEDRPRVLYVLWDDPLQSAGPRTFVGQMISEAGGINLFADTTQKYPRVSDEVILIRNPDLIIAPDHGAAGLPGRLARRPGWQNLRAVQQNRVRTLPEDLVNRSGPRLIEGLELVQQIIRE